MASIDLGSLGRPNSASIFATDPATLSTIVSFILTDIAIPVPNRVRMDLLRSGSGTRRASVARSPVVRAVADNIVIEPESVTITGSLSANPLGPVASRLGAGGSTIRRDLRELDKLRKIQERREPVVLVTPWRVYPSMSMSIADVHDGSHKVELTLAFEEFRIISILAIAGVLDLETILAGANSTTNSGAQATTSVATDVGGGLG